MAGIKAPIQDILTKLSTIQVTNGDSKTVSLYARIWNNQIEAEKAGESYAYSKPAAFVEVISPVIFEELGQNYRSADLGISIHLVHEYYNLDGTFEQDLAVFDIRDKIVAALSQFKPTGCGQLVSTGEEQDFNHDNIYHYVISLVCNFIDSKASQYDAGRGVYLDKTPPTDLTLNVTRADTPIFDLIPQPYKIPK